MIPTTILSIILKYTTSNKLHIANCEYLQQFETVHFSEIILISRTTYQCVNYRKRCNIYKYTYGSVNANLYLDHSSIDNFTNSPRMQFETYELPYCYWHYCP